jgi:hypothetical protein
MPVWEGNLHAEAFYDVGEHEAPDPTVADLTQGFMGGLGAVRIAQPVAYGTMSASLRLVANKIGLADFSHPHRIEECRIHSHLSAPHKSRLVYITVADWQNIQISQPMDNFGN